MPPAQAVWTLAWPVIVLGVLRSAFFLGDAWWVGKLGPEALEGQTGATFATWILHVWADLAAIGGLAIVSRAVGAKEHERGRQGATQSLILALALGLLTALAYAPLTSAYFSMLGFTQSGFALALNAGTVYLQILLWASPFFTVFIVTQALFRAHGDTRTPMLIMAGSLLLNLALDPVLMFGWLGAPALGVAGAAWATGVSNLLGMLVGILLLARRQALSPRLTPDLALWSTIARIGSPMFLAGLGFCLVYVLLGPIITHFGTGGVAALGVGHRIESLSYLFAYGTGTAIATLVGQNLGAHRPDNARACVRAAERILFASLLPLALLYFFAAPYIFAIFSDDPIFIARGSSYLRWIAPSIFFMGWEILYEQAWSGVGDTLPPTRITLPLTIARIPLAWVLAFHTPLGLNGVWIAIAGTTIIKGVLLRRGFHRADWHRKLGVMP